MFVNRSQDNSTPSTFTFASRQSRLDRHVLSSQKLIKALENSDIETLQPIIRDFTFANLDRRDLEYFRSSSMIHIFKLTQLGIEYLIHTQDRLLAQNTCIRQNYNSLVNYEASVKDQIMNNEREIKQLEQRLKDKKKLVKEREKVIQDPKTANVFTKALVRASAIKCPYCPKHFISSKYQESHVRRRHGDIASHELQTGKQNGSTDINQLIHTIQRIMTDQIQSINQIHNRDMQALTSSFQKQLNELSLRSSDLNNPVSAGTKDVKDPLTQSQQDRQYFESFLQENTQQVQQANLTLSIQKQDQLQCKTSTDLLTFNAQNKVPTSLNLSKTDCLIIQPTRSITSLPSPSIPPLVFVDYLEDIEEFPIESEKRNISLPIFTPRKPKIKSNVGMEYKESLNPLLSDMNGYKGEHEDTPRELIVTRRFSPQTVKYIGDMFERQNTDEDTMISMHDEQQDTGINKQTETQQAEKQSKSQLLTQFSTPVISLSEYHIDVKPPPSSESILDLYNEPLYLPTKSIQEESQPLSANQILINPQKTLTPEESSHTEPSNELNEIKLKSPELPLFSTESSHKEHNTHKNEYISTSELPLSDKEDATDINKLISSHELPVFSAKTLHRDNLDESKLITRSKLELFSDNLSNLNESKLSLTSELAVIPAASTYESSTLPYEYHLQESSKEIEEMLYSEHFTPEIPLSPADLTDNSAIETDREHSIYINTHLEEEINPSTKKQTQEEIGTEFAAPETIEISGKLEICITQEDKLRIAAEMIGLNWEKDIRYRYLADHLIEATQDYDVLIEDNPIIEQYRYYFQDLKQNHDNIFIRSMNILSDEPMYLTPTEKYNYGLQTYFQHDIESFKQTKHFLKAQLKSNSLEFRKMKNSVYKRYERRVNRMLDRMIEEMLRSIHLDLPISKKTKRLLERISDNKESSFSGFSSDSEEDKHQDSLDSDFHTPLQTPTDHRKLEIEISPLNSDQDLKTPQEFYSPVSCFSSE